MTSTRNEICNETLTERAMRIEPPGRGAPSGQRRAPEPTHRSRAATEARGG